MPIIGWDNYTWQRCIELLWWPGPLICSRCCTERKNCNCCSPGRCHLGKKINKGILITFRTLKLVPGDVPSLNACHFMFTQKLNWKWKSLRFFIQAFPLYEMHHVLLEKCKSNFVPVLYYILLNKITNIKGHHCTWHIVGHLEMSLSSPSPSFTCRELPLILAQSHHAEHQNPSVSALESIEPSEFSSPPFSRDGVSQWSAKNLCSSHWSFLFYLN